MVAFALQDLANDVHNFGAKRGASHEDALDNGRCESFQLGVAILDELERWVAQFVELRSDQVLEYIDRGETRNGITFVHGDGSLNGHIRVFLSSIEGLKVRV